MNNGKVTLVVLVGSLIMAILQQSAAPWMAIFGVKPIFGLMFAVCCSLLIRPGAGAAVGSLCGLLEGCIPGANLTHYVVSRTVSCFLASLSRSIEVEFGVIICAIVVVITTFGAEMVFMFLAPPPDITRFVQDTIGSAMYNGVLAIPTYALLRKIAKPKKV